MLPLYVFHQIFITPNISDFLKVFMSNIGDILVVHCLPNFLKQSK